MAVKPTLVLLAAGMSTRYGSLKQLDKFGPHGETIMDYSIYDARRAGFGKVIFVIREAIAAEFRAVTEGKYRNIIPIEFVCQELHKLPPGFGVPENRVKPWGTAHAVWVAGARLKEPFAVLNSDDFYGYESFKLMADFLQNTSNEAAIIGYTLENTLSEHGAVSRGTLEIENNGYLNSITEQTQIQKGQRGIVAVGTEGDEAVLDPAQLVSMNLMGFPVTVLPHFENYLKAFLEESAHIPKAELYLPTVVNKLVQAGTLKVKVLPSPEKWFGVTYPDDKPMAVAALHHLIKNGVYPENLSFT